MFPATKKGKAFRPTVWDTKQYVKDVHAEQDNRDAVFPINRFPAELRHMIWDAALLQESTQRLVLMATWYIDKIEIVPRPNLISPYLSTCVESRERALKFYYYREEVFTYQLAGRYDDYKVRASQKLHRGTVYINPKYDIFLDWDEICIRTHRWMQWNASCGPLQCLQDIQKVCKLGEAEPTYSIQDGTSANIWKERQDLFPNMSRWLLLYIRCDLVEVNRQADERRDLYEELYEDDLRLLCDKGWPGVTEYLGLFNGNHRLAQMVEHPRQEGQPGKPGQRFKVLDVSEAATAFDDQPKKQTKLPNFPEMVMPFGQEWP
ncbi:hypothetical protein GGR57DRAFT_514910 [Xylariaceae sp. FL1272]|nr:hypothetical protein GGR57DRAFT_514910 [Xylariaceae sp. FL1272]